jgi:hypothetical protein
MALQSLHAAGADDISQAIGISPAFPYRLTWFELRDRTCVCLISKPDATGAYIIDSILVGAIGKRFGGSEKWPQWEQPQEVYLEGGSLRKRPPSTRAAGRGENR